MVAPQITSQPNDQTVTEGQTANFSVTATGTGPLSYQWRKDGSNISGATSASYSISSTNLSDAGDYSVRVSNSAGNVTSNNATLTVNQAVVAPQITGQPQNLSVTEGQLASFGVTVTGTAPLSYQWQKDGVNIPGATSNSYTINGASFIDAGAYRVIVSSSGGSVTSNQADLTVTQNAQSPQITGHPQSLTVTEGQAANFSVTATGTAALRYQWQKDGVNITGATSASYSISTTSLSDVGDYWVVVSNTVGSATSNQAVLTVNETANSVPTAEIITPEEQHFYKAGDTIYFSGRGMDNEDGLLDNLIWSLEILQGNQAEPGPALPKDVKSGTFIIPDTMEASADTRYRLHLEVVDSEGLRDKTSIDLSPLTTVITYATEPAGLEIALDGRPLPAPSAVELVEGAQIEVEILPTQVLNGNTYQFDHWEHGGPANQIITIPESEQTYTAVFPTCFKTWKYILTHLQTR